MNYHTSICDPDELFFQQNPTRDYFIRHAEFDEIDARLGDLWEEPPLPEGMRYFALVYRGRYNEMGAMFIADSVDAPLDLDEEACRAIWERRCPGRDARSLCFDCKTETHPYDGPSEFYGVWDDIWAAAGMHPHGPEGRGEYLCIGCLETRLGRTLMACDFFNNDTSATSTARLNDRMTREPEKTASDQVMAARFIARIRGCYAMLSANAAQVTAGTGGLRSVLAYDKHTMECMLADMEKLAKIDRKIVLACWEAA